MQQYKAEELFKQFYTAAVLLLQRLNITVYCQLCTCNLTLDGMSFQFDQCQVRQWQWLLEMMGYYSHSLLLLSYCAAWLKIDCWEEPLWWQGCNGCCHCHHCVVVSIIVIIVHIGWCIHGHPCTEAVSSSSAGGFDNIFRHLPIITPFIVHPNDTLWWSSLDHRNDAELRIVSPHSMKWHENSK